jgi:hypothetical protein
MPSRWSVIIASDPDHERVYAEVSSDNKFVAVVSQETGPDHLRVEAPGLGLDENQVGRNIDLAGFIRALEAAAKKRAGERPSAT